MWERFSYCGMRALLMFFLADRFAFSDSMSLEVYGSYAALVFALLAYYRGFFASLAALALLLSVLAFAMAPSIRRCMGMVR